MIVSLQFDEMKVHFLLLYLDTTIVNILPRWEDFDVHGSYHLYPGEAPSNCFKENVLAL